MCFEGDSIYFLINNRTLPVSEDERIPDWLKLTAHFSQVSFAVLDPSSGVPFLICNSAGMETKYSPFNITSILRHDSFAPNRGHFRVRPHQAAVSCAPVTMSLAERLAGNCPLP